MSLGELDASPIEKIVLYSTGDLHAAQAWMLLRGRGLSGASTLQGGLEGWKSEVLFPVMPANPSPEAQARFQKAAHVATVFDGQPRASSAGSDATAVDMSALKAAAASVAPPKLPQGGGSRGHQKTLEGC